MPINSAQGLFLFFTGTLFCFIYGTIRHSLRPHNVAGYHRYYPCTVEPCFGVNRDINPHHHPDHCWEYFYHPPGTFYFPNTLNTSYPVRDATKYGGDISPYSTASSYTYVILAVALVLVLHDTDTAYVRSPKFVHPSAIDIGGIVLSLAWLGASSAEFHRVPNAVHRHNDWHMIAPLCAWIGADAVGLERWLGEWAGYLFKFAAVFSCIYVGYVNYKIAVAIGLGVLVFGYGFMFHLRKWLSGTFRQWDAIRLLIALLLGWTALACKLYGTATDGDVFIHRALPSNSHHSDANCLNNVNAARLEDISHAWWQTFCAFAVWVIVVSLFDKSPFSGSPVIVGAFGVVTVGILVCSYVNSDHYTRWLYATYISFAILIGATIISMVLGKPAPTAYSKVWNPG
jgi:hypothetical protein